MKQHLLKAAAFAAVLLASSAAMYGQSVVLRQNFEGETFPPEGWTVLDNDGDTRSWIAYSGSGANQIAGSRKLAISFTRNPQNYNETYGTQDNWLITPPIAITNNAHVLEFKYAAQDLDKTEPMEILISESGIAPSDFVSIYTTTADNGYEDDVVIETLSRALSAYNGKTIRIAIRHNANSTYGLSVDNVYVYNQLGPVKPTAFTATAGTGGIPTVTLAWTNPSRTGNGQTLTDLSIRVYRDGEPLTLLTEGMTPGQSVSWTDQNPLTGTLKYTIAAVNAEGETEPLSEKSVYVGEDVPAAPKNITSFNTPQGVRISWDAPTKGANNGYVDLSGITYQLNRATADGTEIIASGLRGTTYTDTPPQGVMCVYSVNAVSSGGMSPVDAYSYAASIVYGDDVADMAVASTPDKNNALARLPIALNDKYSISQSLYTPADLAFVQGDIKKLVYKGFRGTDSDLTIPVRIYIAPTEQTEMTAAFVPMDQASLVYDGNITLSTGTRDIEITLQQPYTYVGGNMVVTFIKDNIPNGSYSDRFISKDMANGNRSFTKSVYDAVNIASLPTASSYDKALSELPYTRFIIETSGIGALQGTVSDAATSVPLAGATLTVSGYEGMSTVSATDGTYRFNYVPVAANQMTVTVPGYADVTRSISVNEGQTTVADIAMNQLAHYTLAGSAVAADTRLPATGAIVTLSGYDNASTVADENGAWSIENVYSGKDYTLSVAYPLYDIYRTELTSDTQSTLTLPAIDLQRSLIPPYALQAQTATDGTVMNLTWADPLSRENPIGWKSVGDVSVMTSDGGDYSSTNYNVGHYFSSALAQQLGMTGLSIGEIRVYLKATEGTFTAKVWKGTRDNNEELTAQVIPADLITPTGSWVTVKLDNPVEIKEGIDYIIGLQCQNASRYPIGTAAGSTVAGGSNKLKWSDEGGYIYDGYSPWCIEGHCIVPGTEVEISQNENAPACQYNLYRSMPETNGWEKLTSSPVSELSFTDRGWAALVSAPYTYAVTAVYMNGESEKAYSEKLTRSVNTDAGVVAFIAPLKSVDVRDNVEVTVEIKNFGEMPVSDFPVSVRLNQGTPISTTFSGTLNKGQTAQVTIGTLEMGEGVHTLTAYTSVPGDAGTANDALSMLLPNIANIELTAYRWSAYGNAGFMKVQTNNPENATFLREVTPGDALITAGEAVVDKYYAYTATWWGASRQFVEIDPTTWTVQRAIENTDDYILDMAYDHTNSVMYALRAGNGEDVQLVTVNLQDGTTDIIGTLGMVVRTLACDLTGTLYAISDNGDFYAIDPLTAVATLVGATGVERVIYLQSMAFDHNTGRLFWAMTGTDTDGAIHEVDPATGHATLMGQALYDGQDQAELVGIYTPYDPDLTSVSAPVATDLTLTAHADGTIRVSAPKGGKLTVCTPDGAVVLTRQLPAGITTLPCAQAKGIYMVTVTDGQSTRTIKTAQR